MSGRRSVLIIGAGFSGTALAANLLRSGSPVHVVLANRFGPMGRGIAYGTSMEAHLLNVPAGQMSAYADLPDHFLDYARRRDPAIGPETYVPRRFYGEYLEEVLAGAEALGSPDATLERVVGEATSLLVIPGESGARVRFGDGSIFQTDRVVLALGNYSPPDPPAVDRGFYETERYIRDPWVRGALDRIRPGESVLLVGTGLTMMDIALDLRARGAGLPLWAVSRHGLLPLPQGGPSASDPDTPFPPDIDGPPWTVARYVRAVRTWVAEQEARGGDWRGVVGSLRERTPELWQALGLEERSRFLRHVRPYWEIHRHRAAPETASSISTLIASGGLRLSAGRILEFTPMSDGVDVTLRRRGSDQPEVIRIGRVVNCTGPDSNVRRLREPFLRDLLERGWIRPDPLGLGVETAPDGALLDAEGSPSEILFLLGPLLKSRFWESTAVPELRQHALRLARVLCAR